MLDFRHSLNQATFDQDEFFLEEHKNKEMT